MFAKVKPECRYKTITAFNGHEYTQREWRKVPIGFEQEALRHSFLITMEAEKEKASPVVAVKTTTPVKIIEAMKQVEALFPWETAEPENPEPSVEPDEEDETESEPASGASSTVPEAKKRGGRRRKSKE